ncbi:MAG: hypothetical protein R3C05_22505 [Pirellulaceae bacterium]
MLPDAPAHLKAVEYRKHLDTAEAAIKAEREAEKDAEKQKALDEKLKQLVAAKGAADKEIANLAKTADRKIFVESQPYQIEVLPKE